MKRKNTFQHYKLKSPSDAPTHSTTPPKDHDYRASGSVRGQADRQADPTPHVQNASLNLSTIPLAGQVARDSSGMGLATLFGIISERAIRMAKKGREEF